MREADKPFDLSQGLFMISNGTTWRRLLGARFAPEFCEGMSLLLTEGAGKAGCPPHPRPPCVKNARGRNHRCRRKHPAFPAQWFYGLYALSPGTGLSCPRRSHAARESSHCELDLSVGRPGPHDFTVCGSFRQSARPAWYRPAGFSGGSGTASLVARHRRSHRIPPPTSVTTAKRPSCGGGTGEEKHKLPKNRSKIFFARGLDSRISVELICEFGFFAHAMLPVEAVARRARPRRDRLISRSSGKSVA